MLASMFESVCTLASLCLIIVVTQNVIPISPKFLHGFSSRWLSKGIIRKSNKLLDRKEPREMESSLTTRCLGGWSDTIIFSAFFSFHIIIISMTVLFGGGFISLTRKKTGLRYFPCCGQRYFQTSKMNKVACT